MRKTIVLILCLLLKQSSWAQTDLETYTKIFPDENVIAKTISKDFVIELDKNGELKTSCDIHEEYFYLNDKGKTNSSQSIFESTFIKAQNIEAYTEYKGKRYEVKDFKSRPINGRNIFFDDNNLTEFEFLQPNTGATSVLKYTLNYTNPYLLTEVYFDDNYCIANQDISFKVDKNIDINFIEKNFDASITKTVSDNKKYNIYKWHTTNRKKLNIENFEHNPVNTDYYIPHLIYNIKQYTYKGSTKKVLSGIDDLYRWNYNNVKEAAYANKRNSKPKEIQSTIDSIKSISKTQTELVHNIYNFVQNNIFYIAIEDSLAGFIPRDPELVFHRRYGDCKDMSCLLNYMLKQVGIESYPTWIGTRHIPYKVTEVPLPSCFNHMINTVKVDGNYYFLDATMRYLPYNYPSYGIQGKQALLMVDENKYELLDVPTIEASKNTTNDTTVLNIENNSLIGKVNIETNGYAGVISKYNMLGATKKSLNEDMQRFFLRGNDKCFVSNVKDKNSNTNDSKHLLSADIKVENYISKIEKDYIVNMNLEKSFNNFYMDEKKRISPEEIDYCYVINNVVKLKIPNGYSVKYLPEKFIAKSDIMDCELNYTNNNNEVILQQKYTSKKLIIEPKQFSEWNSMIRKLSAQYKENIILTEQ